MNRVIIIEEEQIVITRVKQTIVELDDPSPKQQLYKAMYGETADSDVVDQALIGRGIDPTSVVIGEDEDGDCCIAFDPVEVPLTLDERDEAITSLYGDLAFEDLPEVEGLVLGDLSDEEVREYETHGVGTYRIENPIGVYIRPGGTTHRVIDANGIAHIVAYPNEGKTVLRSKSRIQPCSW